MESRTRKKEKVKLLLSMKGHPDKISVKGSVIERWQILLIPALRKSDAGGTQVQILPRQLSEIVSHKNKINHFALKPYTNSY